MKKIKELFNDKEYMKYSFYIAFTAGLLYVLYFLIKNFTATVSSVSGFLASVGSALAPLFIGLILAYLLTPLVEIIDGKFMGKVFFRTPKSPKKAAKQVQRKRLISIIVTYLFVVALAILLIYGFAFLIVGKVMFTGLAGVLESIIVYFSQYEELFRNFMASLPESGLEDKFYVILNDVADWISKNFSAEAIIGFIVGAGGSLVNFILGMVVSIYLIKDKDYFLSIWNEGFLAFFTDKTGGKIQGVLSDIDEVFSKFLRGQLLDALIVAIITSVVLTILKVDFAVLLGFFAGLTNVIPYFGPVFGSIPAIIVALFMGGLPKALMTALAFLIIQQIDGNIIGPKVVGSTTGLHPVFILLGVTFGGHFFGLIGMVLAVPVVACLKLFIQRYLNSSKDTI